MTKMTNNKLTFVTGAIAALAMIIPIVAVFWGAYSVYCHDWATSFLMFSVALFGILIIGLCSVHEDK